MLNYKCEVDIMNNPKVSWISALGEFGDDKSVRNCSCLQG